MASRWLVWLSLPLVAIVILLIALSGIWNLLEGRNEDLPTLPLQFIGPPAGAHTHDHDTDHKASREGIDRRLAMAFGTDCKELCRRYRLWLPDPGIVFAVDRFELEQADGRLRLAPFSAALYHGPKKDTAAPGEITTIRADVALVTLDRPVSQLIEIADRELVALELIGEQSTITLAPSMVKEQKGSFPTSAEPPTPGRSDADQWLQMAFATGCEEMQRPIRLWMPDKGMALAMGQFDIVEPDGRVRLMPFSAAVFHEEPAPNATPDVTTIRSDMAFLTLDRPVASLSDFAQRTILKIEVSGKSVITLAPTTQVP